MRLYLVQHAEAKSEAEDPTRPLTEKGLADIKRVARHLKEHANIKVAEINHSGKTRAEQTAQVLAEALAPRGVAKGEGLEPLADPGSGRSAWRSSTRRSCWSGTCPT